MNQGISTIVQIIANVGILFGLILVGVQIREATRIAEAQFSYDFYSAAIESQSIVIGENMGAAWAKAKVNSPDLSDHDLVVIEAFLGREWLHNVQQLQLINAGFESSANLDVSAYKWVYSYLGNTTALRWWKNRRVDASFVGMNPELKERIDTMIDKFDGDLSNQHAEGLRSLRSD
ncbi:MAG: hypothetical protein ACJAR0_004320 [Candidatus Azotimanducaceae bacterium]|jgi:hypothetical protein